MFCNVAFTSGKPNRGGNWTCRDIANIFGYGSGRKIKSKSKWKKNDLTKIIIIKLSCVSDQAIISFQILKSIYFWRFYESQLKKYIRSEEKYFQLTQNYTRNVHSSTMKTNQIMSNNLNEFRKNCTIIFTGNQGSFLSEIVPNHSNLISNSLYNWNFIKTEI